MTAMWFGLAAIALIGAGVLLYVDHIQRQRTGRVRQIWARTQGYGYQDADPTLVSTWHRAALAKQDYLTALDIVTGSRRGDTFMLFDLEDTATFVAVQREIGSDVDLDLRIKSSPPPKDVDLQLLGAMGDRVVFATDLEIARRVCDARMASFAAGLPAALQQLWSEGRWTLGSLPINSGPRDWDEAIDAVTRLSGILHVLPPARAPRGVINGHDPGRPHPVPKAEPVAPAVARIAPPPPPPSSAPPRPPQARPASAARPALQPYQGPAPHP